MKYEKLYINGKIFTADKKMPYADAMAVKNGKIAWIGTMAEESIESNEIIDLNQKRVLPGFVDAHMHAIMLAKCYKQISALPPAVNSIKELIEEIKEARKKSEPGLWIEGWGYDEGKLAEGRSPLRQDLDEGCADSPVMILRTCAHICVVNSKALELAGITRDTMDPPGGKIGRDADGEPNGILYETARDLVISVKEELTDEKLVEYIKNLGDILVSQGVTTCSDMGEFGFCDYLSLFGKAAQKGFKNRVACYYMWDDVKNKEDFYISSEAQDSTNQVRVAGIKLIGDGSVSGRTAWCDVPYLNKDEEDKNMEYGIPVCTEEELEKGIQFAKDNHCQVSIHCMGAKAIERAIEHTWKEKPWISGGVPSVRMEHVAMPTIDSMEKAAEAGIGWITQPIFLYAEIESYLNNMGIKRTKECYPIANFLEKNVRFCFSTDAPATAWSVPSDPMPCLKGAVTRVAWDGTDCGQKHRTDIETAIRLYTAEAAPMLGFTDVGVLREGYAADFIVLDRDILSIEADDIDKVKIDETYIAGECVYRRC